MRIFAAILAFSVALYGVSNSVLAGPQDYCVAYAGQFANTKMGISADHLVGTLGGGVRAAPTREGDGGTDEKWQGVYNKTFGACMEHYELVTAAIDPPDTSKAKRQKAKARKRGTKSKRTSAAIGAPKPESQKLQPTTVAPAAHDESLCRRVRVSKGGAYHIENCGRARSRKNRAVRP